ncbi:raffinose/stachyose/melibiose transport system substrate-binding protein [Paenibacillus endophyticus]|uniref:Raffinose/stachyose/melibiose transport system substrate-binding protein n=1 Tax=Paenibacillus endophyticus TaxID=1294268 RepID=A0A7W5GCR2_9BACL|nr:ABC transporter substrate-binding protein [Paenibacillus endophyticus]MBB3155125.1 raffinose/stachyose/melibiose transport system substrate-binding protein [Paenibacillus endophyticus]
MANIRKALSMATCVLTVAAVTAGCGSTNGNNIDSVSNAPSPSGNTASTDQPTKKNMTLTVMASQDQIMDAEVELAKTFEANTGIKIDYQIVPSDQFTSLIGAKLNSGEGPDVIVTQGGKLTLKSTLDPEKNLEDLSGEGWVSTLKKPFDEGVSYNGKVYGLPLWDLGGTSSWVLVYNKKIFSEQGLMPPKTYDELLDVSAKLSENGITPIYEAGSDGWHHQLPLLEMGPRVEELSGGLYDKLNANETLLADSPEMLKLVEQVSALVEKGYYGKEHFSNTYADAYNAMSSGKFAMIFDRSNFGNELLANKSDSAYKAEDFGAVVMPFLDNQTLNVNPQGPSKFVYKNGKHVAEAKQFLAYLAEPSNMQTYLDQTSRFSELPFEGVTPKKNAVLEEIKAGSNGQEGAVLQSGVSYIDPQWMDIGKDLTAVFSGKLDPADLLKNIDKRRSQQATAQKDPAWSK